MNPCIQAGLILLLLGPSASVAAQRHPSEVGSFPPIRYSRFQRDSDTEREKARQEIGINAQQQEQLTHLYADADAKEKAMEKQLHDLYKQQHALYSAYVIDHAQEHELRKKIQQMHGQLLQLHADTEDGLRKILTREQFERLNAALNAHRRGNRHDRDRHNGEEKTPRPNDQGANHEDRTPLPPERPSASSPTNA